MFGIEYKYVSAAYVLCLKAKKAGVLRLVHKVTSGKTRIWDGHHNGPVVNPIVVVSILLAIIISLVTKRPFQEQVDQCFG